MPSLVKKIDGFKKMRDMNPKKYPLPQKKKPAKKKKDVIKTSSLDLTRSNYKFDKDIQKYSTVEKYMDNAIIENGLFDKYFSRDYKKMLIDVEVLEEKLKSTEVTVQKIRRLAAKYYLKNETEKTNLDNLHLGIKEKISFLNQSNSNNKYCFKVDSEVLAAEDNKHVYVVYRPSIIEYAKVNLYFDIFCKIRIDDNGLSEYIGTDFNSIHNKLEILKVINKYHKSLNHYKEVDKKEGIAYYNEFISTLKKEIRIAIKKFCSADNDNMIRITEDIVSLEKYCRSAHTFQLQFILDYYFQKAKERNDYSLLDKVTTILSDLMDLTMTIPHELIIA